MTESYDLRWALLGVAATEAYARCPYRLQDGGEGRYGPNTCIGGCWEEPMCVTSEPEGGWGSGRVDALEEVAYNARIDAAEARGRHGAVKHARDVMRWADRRVVAARHDQPGRPAG